MSAPSNPVSIESLLAHQDWLRRLAQALVRDANDAEDLVQETMLSALRSPPKTGDDTRNWLAVVLRNGLSAMRRSSKRRGAREQAVARKEALPATLEALALASMQQELVERVLKLDEPLREVVLLRFFSDMPPREIAEQLGRPLNSVKSSLQRGLAQLRADLDARPGGRQEWLAVLVPFAAPVQVAVATKTWLAAALLVLVGGVAWMVVRTRSASHDISVASSPSSLTGSAAAVEPAPAPSSLDDAWDTQAAGRSAASGGAPSNLATEPRRATAASTSRVRFVDLEGTPLAGIRVHVVDADRPRWSDATETAIIAPNFWLEVTPEERSRLRASPAELERFVARWFADAAVGRALILGTPVPDPIVVTDDRGELVVERARAHAAFVAEGFALLATGRTSHDRLMHEWTSVLAPARALRGRLIDAEGRALAGMEIGIGFDGRRGFELPVGAFEFSRLKQLRARTDDAGRFAFDSVPRVRFTGFSIPLGEGRRFVPHAVEVEELDGGAERLVQVTGSARTDAPAPKPVIGRVLRVDGSPALRARVVSGMQVVDADLEGRFELPHGAQGLVWILERSYGYATLEAPRELPAAQPDGTVELVLALACGSIEGVVLDERRLPAAGVDVRITDPTRAAVMREPIEAFLAGTRGVVVKTDEFGRFRFGGLLQREYTLSAGSPSSGLVSQHARPSTGLVTLELPDAGRTARVQGRVMTLSGEPIHARSASVFALRELDDVSGRSWRTVSATTSLSGGFDVTHVACPDPILVVTADGYMPAFMPLVADAPASDVEVRLAPACKLAVSIPTGLQGERLCVHDATGAEVDVMPAAVPTTSPRKHVELSAESTANLLVSVLATEVVLVRGGTVVARRTVRMHPDLLTRVEF